MAYTYAWRKGELLNLRVRNVNLVTRKIRLDVGTTKNKEGREVKMTAKAAELVRACAAGKKPDDYVLTRGKQRLPVRDMRDAWYALTVRAGLGRWVCARAECGGAIVKEKCEKCRGRGKEYAGLIPHDLRRSGAKAMRRAGVPESTIMSTGGWKTASMFRRYAITSDADQCMVVELLERAREKRRQPPFGPLSGRNGARRAAARGGEGAVKWKERLEFDGARRRNRTVTSC